MLRACVLVCVRACIPGWLRKRPIQFYAEGVWFRLVGCRLGCMEIQLLSDWVRSKGHLPCLSVVVRGLELRFEASLHGGVSGDNGKKHSIHTFVSSTKIWFYKYIISCLEYLSGRCYSRGIWHRLIICPCVHVCLWWSLSVPAMYLQSLCSKLCQWKSVLQVSEWQVQ